MTLLLVIGSTFIAVLGFLTALDEWAQHAKTPGKWALLDRQRRAFLTMTISAVVGLVGGTFAWSKSREAARVRDLLFDLEVLLAQLDGLVSSALVQGNIRTSLGPMQVLIGLIGTYGFKAAGTVAELGKRLSEGEYQPLKEGVMTITVGLDRLEIANSPDESTVTSALVEMQRGIRLSRSHARHLINERILQ